LQKEHVEMKTPTRKAAPAALLGALLASGALAQASIPLPPVHTSGSVEYLSGGIGADESAAIRNASGQWPLTLEFAIKDRQRADFAADVKVRVLDAGQAQRRKVDVKAGKPSREVFLWGTGADKTGP
jgi:type IV secretory pathway TrbL component